VGHVARLLEDNGIATVIIAASPFEERLRVMTLPRVLLTPNVMGHPVGPPGNVKRQRETLTTALQLIQQAEQVSTLKHLPGFLRPKGT